MRVGIAGKVFQIRGKRSRPSSLFRLKDDHQLTVIRL